MGTGTRVVSVSSAQRGSQQLQLERARVTSAPRITTEMGNTAICAEKGPSRRGWEATPPICASATLDSKGRVTIALPAEREAQRINLNQTIAAVMCHITTLITAVCPAQLVQLQSTLTQIPPNNACATLGTLGHRIRQGSFANLAGRVVQPTASGKKRAFAQLPTS
jgi:hypothetical protein